MDDFIPLIPILETIPSHVRQRLGWEGLSAGETVVNLAGHYSYGVYREKEASALLLRDEELALPDDLDYFR